MAGRCRRQAPVKNTLASLGSALLVALGFWILFAVCRWDFSLNPATFPMGERIVLVIVLVIVYIIALDIDPEDA
jgi:cytochrome c biogenesis protein CcdA